MPKLFWGEAVSTTAYILNGSPTKSLNDVTPEPQRIIQPPERFGDYTSIPNFEVIEEGDMMHLILLAKTELVSFEQTIREPKWKATMEEELRAIEKNHMWELVTLPHNKRSIGVKWVYKVKVKPIGEVAKYKARILAKTGLDYNEVFAPVARIETIRLVMWLLHQLDVKSAFVNGPLEEEVYVCPPPSFEVTEHENKVYKLKKVLYGLKQAPRAWNDRIDCFLLQLDFNKCTTEYGVYMTYWLPGAIQHSVNEFKRIIMLEFEMIDLGLLSCFLGMEFVTISEEGIFMHQKRYATLTY
ncbi:hypothetical protein CR513_14434, partial [Mucuna pruriens]